MSEQIISDTSEKIIINLGSGIATRSIGDVEAIIAGLRQEKETLIRKLNELRNDVRETFKDKLEDKDDTAKFDLEETNDLLNQIGAETLSFSWAGVVNIQINVVGIEATNENDVEDMLLKAFSIKLQSDHNLGDNMNYTWETETDDIESEDE